jgi:hypothetical protein
MDLATLSKIAQNVASGGLAHVDWQGLKTQLGAVAEQAIVPVIDGEASDLKTFGAAIGSDMVMAIMQGNTAWQGRLKDQMKVLEELGRIRTNKGSWDLAEQSLSLVFRAAVAAIGASIPK